MKRMVISSLIVLLLCEANFTQLCDEGNQPLEVLSSTAASTSNADEEKKKKALESFARDVFHPGIPGIKIDGKASLATIIKRFGEPVSKTNKIVNGLEVITLKYDGLIFSLSRNPEAKTYWVLPDVTSPRYKLKYGLAVGQPKAAFLKVLGPPNDPEALDEIPNYTDQYKDKRQPLYYAVGKDEEQRLVVTIWFDDNNLATRILSNFPTSTD